VALNTSVNQENRRKRRRKEDSKRRDIKRKRVMIPTMKMKHLLENLQKGPLLEVARPLEKERTQKLLPLAL